MPLSDPQSSVSVPAVTNFWRAVAAPCRDRPNAISQGVDVARTALEQSSGDYRRALPFLGMPDSAYKKFMDCFRRHKCNVDLESIEDES